MEKIFDNLIKVQDIFKDIKYLHEEIDALPKEYNSIKKRYEKSLGQIEKIQAQIAEIDKGIDNLELSIEVSEKKIKEYEEAETEDYKMAEMINNDLYEVIGKNDKNKKALEKEKSKKLSLQKKIGSEEGIVNNLKSELEGKKEFIDSNIDEKLKVLKKKEKERDKIYKELPEGIVEKFDRIIRNKEMKGIVPLYDNYCSGCNMVLPHAFVNRVRKQKDIIFCPYCSRILYYEESGDIF